jgi:diketogulonate reductase-like aldo/keto reductase
MNGMTTAAAAGKIRHIGVSNVTEGQLPGSGSPEHVEQNVAAASIELTAEEIRAINRAVLS